MSNPFVNNSTSAQEIYALGFRDPQTFSFARDHHGEVVLIVFEIGAREREEVNIVRAGGNYGWEIFEGTRLTDLEYSLQTNTTHSSPVIEYDHVSGGNAIIGGLIVSDPSDDSFQNKLIFSDLPTGKIFFADYIKLLEAERTQSRARFYEINSFKLDGVEVVENIGGGLTNPGLTFEDVIQRSRGDVRFGADEFGAVYLVSKQSGVVFKTNLVLSSNYIPDNLVTNGSFETPGNQGWQVGGGQLDRHYSNAAFGRSSSGQASMPLGGWSDNDGQWIEQNILTQYQRAYTLTFDAGVNHGFGSGELQIRISSANDDALNTYISDTTDNANGMTSYRYDFNATGSESKIRFTLINGSTVDYDIDNVIIKHSDNKIRNGSFEQGNSNWVLGGDQDSRHYSNAIPGRSSIGKASMPLGGWSDDVGQSISQSIPTVAGRAYTLEFDAGVTFGSGLGELLLTVDGLDGLALQDSIIDHTDNDNGLIPHTYEFNATGTLSTLTFELIQGNTIDYDIDNISVRESTNLLRNGSFEQGNISWELGGGQLNRHYKNATLGRFSSGRSSLPLGGWSDLDGQWVSQSLPTVAGRSYELTFDAGVTYGNGTGTILLTVEALGGEAMREVFSDSSYNQNGMIQHAYTFNATGPITTIRFLLLDGERIDYDIDDIVLKENKIL